MSDVSQLLTIGLAAILGGLVGAIYFGGLWVTVRRMPDARNPWATYAVSLLGRLAIALGALCAALTYAGWPQILASVAGFLVVRFLLTRWLGRLDATTTAPREAA